MANDHGSEAPAGPPYLIHTFEHKAYPITPERGLVIGRDTDADIVVNEVSVSRKHAEVRREGSDAVLDAVGSTPTLLNDMPVVAPHILQEGDTITVGTMRFVFTRERLPVAMAVATTQGQRWASGIDDQRPTLKFSRQDQGTTPGGRPWGITAVVVIVVIAIVAYVVAHHLE